MPRGPIEWNATSRYEGSSDIADVVFLLDASRNPIYYRAMPDVGEIPIGTPPTDTRYWRLMNHFDSIATGLLLANMALIAGFKFYEDRISKPTAFRTFCLMESTGSST